MKAIISDIHSNLEALQAVLADIAKQPVDAIYCLGDVIGYGPDRASAIEVLGEALDRLEVEGVECNRALLREVLASEDFARGAVTTRWLEEVALT